MLSEKTNKVQSAPGSQTKATQQSELQQLSLAIQQFSSQLNLMLSQQQQKHSDIGVRNNTMDSKQEQPSHFQQHQQLQCPMNSSRYFPIAQSHSNFCSNALGTCSKINNNERHCHSTCLSPSLSTAFPIQQQHCHPTACLHESAYQNYHHHSPLAPYGYDTCTPSMMCYCHPHSQQCTTTNTLLSPQINSTILTGNTHLHHQHENSVPNTLDPSTNSTCPPPVLHSKFKSRTGPLPPIPNEDMANNDDNKATMDEHLDIGRASSCTAVSTEPICDRASLQPSDDHSLQEQHSQVSWTDLYRQDILAKQDTLISSYNNLDSIHITDNKKEVKARSKRSHLRGWWSHGKYKWNQLR